VLHKLIGTADVFLHNIRPAKTAGIGVDYATLTAVNERLV
jgi:crotonobetainyl-CoA:carnitine CoA-transferase CaiB-like acyl-CoA transferase